jgi:hypothetical protein
MDHQLTISQKIKILVGRPFRDARFGHVISFELRDKLNIENGVARM